jgi:hypothetical protein
VDLGFVGGDCRRVGQLDQHNVPVDVCSLYCPRDRENVTDKVNRGLGEVRREAEKKMVAALVGVQFTQAQTQTQTQAGVPCMSL